MVVLQARIIGVLRVVKQYGQLLREYLLLIAPVIRFKLGVLKLLLSIVAATRSERAMREQVLPINVLVQRLPRS
jgi:hypothetical protein